MQIEIEEKSNIDFLATKVDVADLKTDLKTDIANIKVDIANLEIRLVNEQKKQFTSFVTILVALFSIIVGIILYMINKIG